TPPACRSPASIRRDGARGRGFHPRSIRELRSIGRDFRSWPETANTSGMSDTTPEKPKLSWWRRLSDGLKRTSSSLGSAVAHLVTKRKLDRAMLEDIEDVLLRADLGTDVAARIAAAVGVGRYDKAISADDVKGVVATEGEKGLSRVGNPLVIEDARKPFVILVVGVNGSGKTTTIGKLAAKLVGERRKVM